MAKNDVARLEAAAQGGKAGLSAYDNAISDVNSSQQQALQAAAQRAGALNAPAAFIAKQNAAVAAPYDAALGQLGANQAAAGAYSGALSSASNDYLSSLAGERDRARQQFAGNPGNPLKALSDAISQVKSIQSIQSFIDPSNPQHLSPSEQRAQASYTQSQNDAGQERYTANAQGAMIEQLNASDDPQDQMVLGLIGNNKDPVSALAELQESDSYTKLPPEQQLVVRQAVLQRLNSYYNPWNQLSAVNSPRPQAG